MNKRLVSITLILTLFMSIFNPFQNLFGRSDESYQELWSKVQSAQEKDLPKDVIQHAQDIYDKAKKENNFAQLLKSWITLVETRSNIDPDSFTIDALKPLPHQGPVQTALYDAVMATAYLEMTDTSISDHDADTQTSYTEKAAQLFAAALSDREALYAESASGYEPLITRGEDSKLYNHDLLSVLTRFVLAHSRMTNQQKADLTAETADFYLAKGNREAYTLLRLEHIQYLRSIDDFSKRPSIDEVRTQLRQFYEESRGLEANTDVALAYSDVLNTDDDIDFIRQYLAEQPKAGNVGALRTRLHNYLLPSLSVRTSDDILADRPFDVKLSYRNTDNAKLEVRRFNGYKDEYERQPRLDGALVWERSYTLTLDSVNEQRHQQGYPYQGSMQHDLTLPAGKYVFIASCAGIEPTATVQHIVSMRLMAFRLPDDKVLVMVRDNETGRPVPNVQILRQTYNGKEVKRFTSDAQGELILDFDPEHTYFCAYRPDTDDYSTTACLGRSYPPRDAGTQTSVRLYTDRAIYRPGQTVHVSGISYSQLADETWVNPARSLQLGLIDANRRQVAELTVTTNELGSFDAEFQLPEGLLPGQFQIRCSGSDVSFRVEEYKRPTFEVNARQTASQGRLYTFGDTIQVEALAKAYSGVPVQEAATHYKVETAKVQFWFWGDATWTKLAEGDLRTDDDGIARIPVYLDPMLLEEWSSSVVRYRVTFDVTDQAGETHTALHTFALSRRAFDLQVRISSLIDLAAADQYFAVHAINANEEEVSLTGTYCIYKSLPDAPLFTGTFTTGQRISVPRLRAGNYHLRAVTVASDGREVESISSFQVFDSSKELAEADFDEDFIHFASTNFSEEQDAELFFSPREGDSYVSYHLLSRDKVVLRQSLVLDHQITRLRIPYRAEYGQGVELHIYYLRNGHWYTQHKPLTYVQPQKRLKLEWSTFRDHLYPGQDQEWTLTISDPQGNPVDGAELLATMYDASLDALAAQHWYFSLSFPRQVYHYGSDVSNGNYSYSTSLQESTEREFPRTRSYNELTQYIHDRWYIHSHFRSKTRGRFFSRSMDGGAMVYEEAAPVMMAMRESTSLNAISADNDMVLPDVMEELTSSEAVTEAEVTPEPAIRSNFAETAFFYPHLRSDHQGQVRISFTLPESLTEWHFLGLAHDRHVNYGTISARAVARKDFMVQPNMPRFVREGDHATIATRVINQSEERLDGRVRMRLLDAETEQVVGTFEQPVQVEAGKTTSVTFSFVADERYPMLICEVVGMAGNTSDGERNFLPVLPSSKYVTETIPFYMMASDSTRQVDLHELFNHGSATATHRRLVLEYTQHPEWTVIEALDGIKLPDYDNAPAFAASLYANVMAARLAQSIPGFEQALQAAAAQEASAKATSQLELNQDLRDILLRESPWVIDAINEAEQRARLIDLFDQQKMGERTAKARERLSRLQKGDGSWSWFESMSGSYYITLSVCESLAPLCDIDPDVNRMVTRALHYLDEHEYKDYKELLKQEGGKLTYVGESTLHYLYVCSMMPDREVSRSVRKMRDDMLKVIAKSIRDLTIQGRAHAACVLRAFGRKADADSFVESAVQYTVTRPGMGRYYATDIAYYSWRDYRIPTQLAAMRAIQLSSRADREQLLCDMKVWLLRQKQAQTWDNPMNTIAAVQFLLGQDPLSSLHSTPSSLPIPLSSLPSTPSSLHSTPSTLPIPLTDSPLPRFQLDGTVLPVSIDTTRMLAEQLGYARTQIDESLIRQPLTALTIEAPEVEARSQISWGAVYAQYMEKLDRLQAHTAGELSVEMRLLDAEGKTIDPATTPLHVGDRVTLRLTIRADRDMDFVQVRCQRPACLEPVSQRSGYCWMDGRGGYVALHDASTDIFFDRFTRGTTTFDLQFNVDRVGQYLTGIATAQCAYAPEFCAHSPAFMVNVEESGKRKE